MATPEGRRRRFSVPVSARGEALGVVNEEDASKIPIPSALPIPHIEATPLPVIPLAVLSITVMGEFLCANVSTPFLLFMVRGFNVGEDEAAVGYWTGILVSVFFLTQFLTSLLWATLADFCGRRNVLFVSLIGSAVACTAFGTQTTFQSAVAVRLVQGVFAGAIGVARSSVAGITDTSNEGRAYAIMGFAWGLGGVIGAVIGGTFESPAQKWPSLFGKIPVFVTHPYLLPCALAASVTLTGAAMCLFLDHDGGPRRFGGTVQPAPDPEALPSTPRKQPPPPVRLDSHSSARSGPLVTFAPSVPPALANRRRSSAAVPMGSQPLAMPGRRPSAAQGAGLTPLSASVQNRLWIHRRSSAATRMTDTSDMNLAERLIAANEHQVTSMSQLWVAAAISTEAAVEEDALEFESDDEGPGTPPSQPGTPTPPSKFSSSERVPLLHHSSSNLATGRSYSGLNRSSSGLAPRTYSGVHRTASTATSTIYPAIFANAGVELPPTFLDEEEDEAIVEEDDAASVRTEVPAATQPLLQEESSALKQIPMLVVLQYGLLALHTTTHDQVFYSYLMSKFEAGGLGLTAAEFSQLIAIMSVAQVAYQFYLYPNIGPPRGSCSHLSMFRLGSLLFVPSYLTVVLYRGWSESLVMSGLILSTAVRYCATTFAFTSITILLNYLTPPHAVGLANGLAQSIASLARFAGPALGAKVWEASVKADPGGYALGFWVCAAVCSGALAASFMIR
ncbi:hypothetical protein AURDEDRAFT_90322 [Auricularia subglabra TFB-10046 SS5]|uniref:Major facilitator superfamily MFS-1 n=1 Tax=Auricularia subglabra (strain TFB-10046 / SS5) TaxID=717982 RepID=J0DDE8_AURST|nr:hypothetical protein AURDEDRAFT_90322 [Auricularia subglabra TFB-10046 SS5]